MTDKRQTAICPLSKILQIRDIHKISGLFCVEDGAVECVKHSVSVALARCGCVLR